MKRLLLLLAAVVCCDACRLESFPEDTNNPQGCPDSDGNLHEFDSEWDNGPETCVCVNFGSICCEKMEAHFDGTFPPEPITPQIIAEDPEDPSSNEEQDSHEEPNHPNEPESVDSEDEVKADDSNETADDSNETAEDSNETAEESNETAEESNETAEDNE